MSLFVLFVSFREVHSQLHNLLLYDLRLPGQACSLMVGRGIEWVWEVMINGLQVRKNNVIPAQLISLISVHNTNIETNILFTRLKGRVVISYL